MSRELLDQARDAKTVEEMHRALDALCGSFTRQIDDLDLVAEVVDDGDRYGELNGQVMLLRRACDHARAFLTEANAPVAVPMAKALIVACVAASTFSAALNPAAAEAVRYRRTKRDGTAGARAVRSQEKQIIDAAVAEARRRRLASKKSRPPTPNSFAVDILDEVNRLIAEHGSDTVVKRDAVRNRLKEIDRQEQDRVRREDLFN